MKVLVWVWISLRSGKNKKKIGYMTQYFSMWGNLTIRENLLLLRGYIASIGVESGLNVRFLS
nr:Uncharacterised protein [Klebsiella pneumoniae]